MGKLKGRTNRINSSILVILMLKFYIKYLSRARRMSEEKAFYPKNLLEYFHQLLLINLKGYIQPLILFDVRRY
jgi:hypothetical protein